MDSIKYLYDKSEFTEKKDFYKSKYFLVLILALIITVILIFDQFTYKPFESALFSRKSNLSELAFPDLFIPFLPILLIFFFFISIFSFKKVQDSQINPKRLSKIIQSSSFPIEVIEREELEVIRFKTKEICFELSWYNTTGPYYKWKAKLVLKGLIENLNLTNQIADYLLLEKDEMANNLDFYKIIIFRDLPRHLIAIQYWYNFLQK